MFVFSGVYCDILAVTIFKYIFSFQDFPTFGSSPKINKKSLQHHEKKRNRWSSALHIPSDSGSRPAEVPALPSPDYDCTVGPSPDLFPTADPWGFGSPCPHPWSCLRTHPCLHNIKRHCSVYHTPIRER